MIHMTIWHWLTIAFFALLFIVLTILSAREQRLKTMLAMIFASFLLTVTAAVITLVVLDKYTKKGKILSYATQQDMAHESVIVRGIVENSGSYGIGYCTLEVRVVNSPAGRRATTYFKPTKSFDFMGDVGKNSNVVESEEEIVTDLLPGEQKKFLVKIRLPGNFENPKYYLKLHCH